MIRSPEETRVGRMHALLRPRSVAAVGASPNPSFVSGALRNLQRYGYTGQVVAVNPKYDHIDAAPCYPTLADVPHAVDLAVIGVGIRQIPAVLEDCERKGVGRSRSSPAALPKLAPRGSSISNNSPTGPSGRALSWVARIAWV